MPRRLCQYCTAKLGRFAKLLFIVTCKNCAYRMSMGTSPAASHAAHVPASERQGRAA
jgi:hypothetical protein